MLNIFMKKDKKFYKIETDDASGSAVFYLIGRLWGTSQATRDPNMGRTNTIAFLSAKTSKEIEVELKKTFSDTHIIKNNGAFFTMTPKEVEAP